MPNCTKGRKATTTFTNFTLVMLGVLLGIGLSLTLILRYFPVDHDSNQGQNPDYSGAQTHDADTDHDRVAHDHDGSETDHHDDAQRVNILAQALAEAGGIIASAQSGTVERHASIFGQLQVPPSQQSVVRARFAGVITALNVSLGQQVQAGEILAWLESNESLQRYPLRAPIAGVVTEFYAGVGSVEQAQAIVELVDLRALQAEFAVFTSQLTGSKQSEPLALVVGQILHLSLNGKSQDGKISAIIPAAAQPYLRVRVDIDNQDKQLQPGSWVKAQLDIGVVEATVRVDNRALQSHQQQTVVFVQEGEAYRAVPVQLGLTDLQFSEVRSGLAPGAEYVVSPSYLLLADLAKGSAEHSH